MITFKIKNDDIWWIGNFYGYFEVLLIGVLGLLN